MISLHPPSCLIQNHAVFVFPYRFCYHWLQRGWDSFFKIFLNISYKNKIYSRKFKVYTLKANKQIPLPCSLVLLYLTLSPALSYPAFEALSLALPCSARAAPPYLSVPSRPLPCPSLALKLTILVLHYYVKFYLMILIYLMSKNLPMSQVINILYCFILSIYSQF